MSWGCPHIAHLTRAYSSHLGSTSRGLGTVQESPRWSPGNPNTCPESPHPDWDVSHTLWKSAASDSGSAQRDPGHTTLEARGALCGEAWSV